jgi:hypothetical protein
MNRARFHQAVRDVWETENESPGFSEEDLQELQDRAPQAGSVRDLQGKKAQTAAGMIRKTEYLQAFTSPFV